MEKRGLGEEGRRRKRENVEMKTKKIRKRAIRDGRIRLPRLVQQRLGCVSRDLTIPIGTGAVAQP